MDRFAILPKSDGILFEDEDVTVQAFYGARGGRGQFYKAEGSLFIAVTAGSPTINQMPMRAGMYACVPEAAAIKGDEMVRALVIDARHWDGIFAIGGPIEEQGRLAYMNGCTDTGLLMPYRLGDPCLNGLFFPPGILQTPHHHPSHRIGAVLDGQGQCMNDLGDVIPMRPGDFFIIPAGSIHHFETTDKPMRIIAFHPDSEFGPTDERHQMLEATIV
jgi:mannose-6-phosphate isomerase-like protein (cupin superfamily)